MDVEWCKSPDRGLPAPDAVIFLELPIEDATQRGDFGNERYEEKNFQKSVRERFDSLQKADEKLIPWFTLDARRTIDELHEEIKSIASDVMTNAKDAPIKKLWI
jgi:dTMP kinase